MELLSGLAVIFGLTLGPFIIETITGPR